MLLYIFLLLYFNVVQAQNEFLSSIWESNILSRTFNTFSREKRQTANAGGTPTCEQMATTAVSPFVVILLYETSGRFLGMGSIIDQRTVLTATLAVNPSRGRPDTLLVLAGRKSPWWGEDSQVGTAQDIYANDQGLAVIKLIKPLKFTKNILPVELSNENIPYYHYNNYYDYYDTYDRYFAIFGIPRSSWDTQGETTAKTSIYIMKTESVPFYPHNCLNAFPDFYFNSTTMICTTANGTFCWGCIGSPTVIVKHHKVVLVAVLAKTTTSAKDEYHYHVKVSYYEHWIKAHSMAEG